MPTGFLAVRGANGLKTTIDYDFGGEGQYNGVIKDVAHDFSGSKLASTKRMDPPSQWRAKADTSGCSFELGSPVGSFCPWRDTFILPRS